MTNTTILILEDDFIQREGMATVLRKQGFTVLTAADGSEALNRLSSGSVPDLILLDMIIPRGDGDGWWFAEQHERIPTLAAVPVIIMTSIPVACKEWAASLGAAGLLRKPFDTATLLTEIHRYLSKSDQG
jgi:CheY-like chemotaxis protein